jgi:hypothetical protein
MIYQVRWDVGQSRIKEIETAKVFVLSTVDLATKGVSNVGMG